MNLLIGFVILLCLACSEFQAAEVANDIWTRVIVVALISLTVPGLALFQTLVVTKRLRNSELKSKHREGLLRRLSVCHSAVWLAASLAIIWSVRWQDVVRGNWNLDHWPLLDELIILAPVVFSLVASWAIFYEIDTAINAAENTNGSNEPLPSTAEKLQARIAYVSIRFRVYFLLILIPVSIAVIAKDISPWLQTFTGTKQFLIYGLGTLALLSGFPFLLLLMWRNHAIPDSELKAELFETCRQHKIHVHDVRIWNTQGQIVNALVAGMLPKLRVILLTDALVRYFPRNELLAILRHEAAHLRLWHLPTRIGFAVLPLLALAIDEQNPSGIIVLLNLLMENLGFVPGCGLAFILAGYLVYMLFGFSWISHKMEFEADIYACQEVSTEGDAGQFSHSEDVKDALLRLGAFSPEQFEKSSLLHPSVAARIRLIQQLEADPHKAKMFKTSFRNRRCIAFGALSIMCLTAWLAA